MNQVFRMNIPNCADYLLEPQLHSGRIPSREILVILFSQPIGQRIFTQLKVLKYLRVSSSFISHLHLNVDEGTVIIVALLKTKNYFILRKLAEMILELESTHQIA